jgi:hypothetical protein
LLSVDISGFEPLAKHDLVQKDLVLEPFVADLIETALNVGFEHPRSRPELAQEHGALAECVLSAALQAKAVRVAVGSGFPRWGPGRAYTAPAWPDL